MLKWALVGACFVPLIIGANMLLDDSFRTKVIQEAKTAVGAVVAGPFTGVSLPERGDRADHAPDPLKICGYINNRRFMYDIKTRQFEIDDVGGKVCDPRYYPSK